MIIIFNNFNTEQTVILKFGNYSNALKLSLVTISFINKKSYKEVIDYYNPYIKKEERNREKNRYRKHRITTK